MSAAFPLTLQGVHVRRQGRSLLGPLELTLGEKGTTIVVGPNGSGKTTLLRVMHGIERVSRGEVTWARDNPAKHAFVFQTPIVLRRSVADNLAYPLVLLGTPKHEIRQAVDHWLLRIGLDAVGNNQATRLSGGERQKLAIARALIRKPDVLFLDEPCSNLDGHATREIEALLEEQAKAGTRLSWRPMTWGRPVGLQLILSLCWTGRYTKMDQQTPFLPIPAPALWPHSLEEIS